ncbi:hypothetical protein [Granulicella sibirica]|nr:hypothetical protein [Granulicella sibirica]
MNEKFSATDQGGQQTRSVDEFPELARIARRQLFVIRSYKAIALAPFCLFLFIVLKLAPNAGGRGWDALIFFTLGWAMFVAGVAFRYTFWGFDCPSCEKRFGMGPDCRTCSFPRHAPIAGGGISELNLFGKGEE